MKVFFRLLVVFGILDVVVSIALYFYTFQMPPKIILGFILLATGSAGLFILNKFRTKK